MNTPGDEENVPVGCPRSPGGQFKHDIRVQRPRKPPSTEFGTVPGVIRGVSNFSLNNAFFNMHFSLHKCNLQKLHDQNMVQSF